MAQLSAEVEAALEERAAHFREQLRDQATAPVGEGLDFRLEMLGDPPRPYLVHDGGDRSRPFDPHTMRSTRVDVAYAEELTGLWNALVTAELRAGRAERDRDLAEYALAEAQERAADLASGSAAAAMADAATPIKDGPPPPRPADVAPVLAPRPAQTAGGRRR
jgi:hypothetical protein